MRVIVLEIYATKVFDILSEINQEADTIIQKLDKDRQEKVAKIKHDSQRLMSIFAGVLLRYVFLNRGFSENEWNRIIIEYNEYGKPYIKGLDNFNYSISHSGDWVICAFDDKNIGVDIQKKRPWKIQMAKRFYADAEYKRLINIDENDIQKQTDYFYKLWSAKESCVKYTGRGIGGGISQYVVSNEFEYIDEFNNDGEIINKYNMKIYDELEGYIIAICSEKNHFPDKIVVVESDLLI